jgi:hypothetical protein
MKWVTREHAMVDRIACPWLIKKFIDKEAEFLFVPSERVLEVAKKENAIPFDASGVELGHHGEEVSFDAIIRKYNLIDPALLELAKIVRGADTANRTLTPESPGWFAVARGFRKISKDDYDNMRLQFPAYDALYAFCQMKVSELQPQK